MTLSLVPPIIADEGPDTEPIHSIHPSFYAVHRARLRQAARPTAIAHPIVPNRPFKRVTLQGISPQLAERLREPESDRQAQAPYLRELASTIALPPIDLKNCHRILDLGCRRGDWALDMARRHPTAWILAIDEDSTMIARAEAQALTEGLSNIEFRVGDLAHTCIHGIKGYENRPFNLIHASFIATSIDHRFFSEFIYGLTRYAAPGCLIQWTEMELPITSSRYVERFNRLVSEALRLCGHAFSASNTFGITPMMAFWLKQYNCRVLHDIAHCIDISHGTKMRDPYFNYMDYFGRMMRFYVVGSGIETPIEYARIFDRALADLIAPSFCGVFYVRSLLLLFQFQFQSQTGWKEICSTS